MKTLLSFLCVLYIAEVCGHGRLMDPPARNALWRFGFPNPVNYNDNEVYCGGFGLQFDKNGGKCGVCGDAWHEKQPREHEAGGKFGNGIVGKRYVMGQKIEVEIDLTTNHWGYFELKLCPVNNKNKIVTQECLDDHPLYLADDPYNSQYEIPGHVGKKAILKYEVNLPKGVTCNQCVMQWTYKTGNTWAECKNGTGAIGCGDQEMFVNCADVQIYSNTGGRPHFAKEVYPSAIYVRDKNAPGGRKPMVVTSQVCVARKPYDVIPDMDKWCQQNCLKYPPNCDEHKCQCWDECEGIGRLRNIEGTAVYCQRQCLRYPNTCPKDECKCYSESEKNASLEPQTQMIFDFER